MQRFRIYRTIDPEAPESSHFVSFARTLEAARQLARITMRGYPTHTIRIWDGNELVETIRPGEQR